MSRKMKNVLPCYYAFLVNGMLALVMGAMLPYIINEAHINYSVAGGFLSAFAIGNLTASFIVPPLMKKIGRRKAVMSLTGLIPVFLFVITLVPPVPVLYAAFLLPGLGRGTVSIINNTVVAENDGRTAAMNLLHTMFAIGAFITPFLTTVSVGSGFGWRGIIYVIVFLSSCSVVMYSFFLSEPPVIRKEGKEDITGRRVESEKSFLKNVDFYILGMLLFFYIGVENCVNGWFVTYFKSSGIMSDAYAGNLVSITWFLIMAGRLFTAFISGKVDKRKIILVNCLFATGFFFLMISTHSLFLITLSVAGIGFFFAGIYPTCIASAAIYIKGSAAGMSVLLAIAAIGGIIMPQIVGVFADSMGMSGAIGFVVVDVTFMLVFAVINLVRHTKKA